MTAWRRLRALDAADRRLLAEAALLMVRVRVALWIRPFAALRDSLDRSRTSRRAFPRDPERMAWAVAAVARRLPGMTCLVQSLAAHAMLRRRGHQPQLHIGVRIDACDAGAAGANTVSDASMDSVRRGVRGSAAGTAVPLDAHAWVECDGRVVVGEVDDLAAYGRLQPVRPPASAAPDGS